MSRNAVTDQPILALPQGITAWRNSLFLIFAACGASIASVAARIPTISLELGLSTGQVGLLLSSMAVGSVIGLFASGHVVAHFGSRNTIRVAFSTLGVGLAVASFGIAVFGSFIVSFIALIIVGLSMGVCDVAMNVSGAANEQAIGKTVMPIYHAFFSIGTVIGASLGALAEALHVPLDIHITFVVAIGITSVLVTSRFVLPERPLVAEGELAEPASTWRSRLAIWKEPRTILIGLIVLGVAFTEGSSNDWLSYSMVHGHGTNRAVGALVYSVFLTAMTACRLLGPRVLDRFGRVPVLRTAAALATVGLLLFIFVPVFWVNILAVVLWGAGASLGFPVGMSAAADDPAKAAARVSAVATIGYCAFLIGPPLIGFLGNQFGILNGLLLVLVLVAMSGVLSFAAREPARVRS
ncbi:MAG TPA: MFS transporter [Galbitalea sp.]|jgi:MFS family permease